MRNAMKTPRVNCKVSHERTKVCAGKNTLENHKVASVGTTRLRICPLDADIFQNPEIRWKIVTCKSFLIPFTL